MTSNEFYRWIEGFLAGAKMPLTQDQIAIINEKLSQIEGTVDRSRLESMWTSTNTMENLNGSSTKQLLRD